MSLYTDLAKCKVESEVADIYNKNFTEALNVTIESKFNCDAFFVMGGVPCLIEYKCNENFNNRTSLVKVFIQVLYYLKQFKELPLISIIADLNEYMILNNNVLFPYLNKDLDWTVAPSIAPKCNQMLIDEMLLDSNIMKTIVYKITETVDIEEIITQLNNTSKTAIIDYIETCIYKFKNSKAKNIDRQISMLMKNINVYTIC